MSKEYEERVVAFIDILGFKNYVNKSRDSKEIFFKIKSAIEKLENLNSTLLIEDYSFELNREYAIFSDNIAISYLKSGRAEFNLVVDCLIIQLSLLLDGVLVRGGLTYGKLFHKGNIIFGPALVRAYEIESSISNYPRIVIDDKIKSTGTLYSIDFDGLYFIDYLRQGNMWEGFIERTYNIDVNDFYKKIQNIVESMETSGNIKVNSKINWLKNYCKETFLIKDNKLALLKCTFGEYNRVISNNIYFKSSTELNKPLLINNKKNNKL